LIARQGYHNTSLREITEKADANLASVNYHFGSKERLVHAVLERRLVPLDKERMERLEAVRRSARENGQRPAVRAVIEALLVPTLSYATQTEGGRYFAQIVSQAHADPDTTVKRLFFELIQPVFITFNESLQQALPEVPPQIVLIRTAFAIGAMAHTIKMQTEREFFRSLKPDAVPNLASENLSADAILTELVGFITRGMEGA
jgi:AcrR family transcriptional regulator